MAHIHDDPAALKALQHETQAKNLCANAGHRNLAADRRGRHCPKTPLGSE